MEDNKPAGRVVDPASAWSTVRAPQCSANISFKRCCHQQSEVPAIASDPVVVAVRVRPLSVSEKEEGDQEVFFAAPSEGMLVEKKQGKVQSTWSYDHVFGPQV